MAPGWRAMVQCQPERHRADRTSLAKTHRSSSARLLGVGRIAAGHFARRSSRLPANASAPLGCGFNAIADGTTRSGSSATGVTAARLKPETPASMPGRETRQTNCARRKDRDLGLCPPEGRVDRLRRHPPRLHRTEGEHRSAERHRRCADDDSGDRSPYVRPVEQDVDGKSVKHAVGEESCINRDHRCARPRGAEPPRP